MGRRNVAPFNNGREASVESGLEAGERVVLHPSAGLTAGMQVVPRVIED